MFLLGTFPLPRNFSMLEKLWISSLYIRTHKKSQNWLFLPISCIYCPNVKCAFSLTILQEMHHKFGITIYSIEGYSSKVSCEIGLWWSPRQKNWVSSFLFCLPQYFSFFPFILCLTHFTVTANTFSLLKFKLKFVISIKIYNSFIWDHLANCWGSQANAPYAPHL